MTASPAGSHSKISLGSASAPRWYGQDRTNLPRYIDHIKEAGATAAELVLHHGPAEADHGKVHVLEHDWDAVVAAYRSAGFRLAFHASLHSRFDVGRWSTEPDDLKAAYGELIRRVGTVANEQGAETALVVHGASMPTERESRDLTAGFLSWAGETAEKVGGVAIALEVRRAKAGRIDANRQTIVEVIESVGHDSVGICWDLGHDWENRAQHPAWTTIPPDWFLRHVKHVHVHDAGPNDVVHYPLVLDSVPFRSQLPTLALRGYDGVVTMEVRWRYAASLGEPWDLMKRSYEACLPLLATGAGFTVAIPTTRG